MKTQLENYKNKINSLEIERLSLHAPFYDLTLISADPDVEKLSRKRYELGLEVASFLKVDYVVFHSQFNPMLRLDSYHKNWLKKSFEFFHWILEKEQYLGITILIENMFESSPFFLKKLLDKLNSPRIGICLDIAHVNVYSYGNFEEWIDTLYPFIKYLHLSDNDGKVDRHWALGEGNVDFKKVFKLLEKRNVKPDVCLELRDNEEMRKSIEFIETLKIS